MMATERIPRCRAAVDVDDERVSYIGFHYCVEYEGHDGKHQCRCGKEFE